MKEEAPFEMVLDFLVRAAFNQKEKQINLRRTGNYLPAGLIKKVQKHRLALHKASENREFGFLRL